MGASEETEQVREVTKEGKERRKLPMLDQTALYAPIKQWLESNGFKVLVTGGKEPQIVVPIKDLLPTRIFFVPDIVGVRNSDVAIVEAETDPDKILEVIGKAIAWKTIAMFVFVAYPKETCKDYRILEKYGIGLLSVSEGQVHEAIKILPSDSSELFKVLEIHPLDFQRQAELSQQIKRLFGS
jgi:hypothetical protein